MTRRKIRKIVKRAIHLPRGSNLFKYIANKIYAYFLKKSKSLKNPYFTEFYIMGLGDQKQRLD